MVIRVVLMLWLGMLVRTLPGQIADFFLDPAGKAYYLLEDARLVTPNPLGENTYSFYDSSLGTPDYIDVTNPFQILVYYREYGTVVVLDRTLSELDRIDLFANPSIRQPGVIARSYDNGMWVFDNWNYQLLRLNGDGEVAQQTNNLRLQLGITAPADALFVDRNAIVLYFAPEQRMAVFTNYGKFRFWVPVPEGLTLSWRAPRLLAIGERDHWIWTPDERELLSLGPLPADLPLQPRVLVGAEGYFTAVPGQLEIRGTVFSNKN
ncbi:hypothetical protein CLV84_2082 [Neolewinella xylanilytica]|uniref:Uncharacterized protein n=1 Tax=Neolewinella xylanilytica TaxID=1514080 RepID=A0A2S6I213_9BACT|nr:hypothetical protein [Neolewinella xylanilytica]PPK85190.1 hypothetical protein CLV84_2082 [Neolewinella xylanilytica]